MTTVVKFVNQAVVKKNIIKTFDYYERQAYEIFKYYAAESMRYMASVQISKGKEVKGEFWTNHTMKAAEGYYAKAYVLPGKIGVTLANDVSYSASLESDFGKKYASFPTLMRRMEPMIMRDLRKLYESP